MMYLMYTNYLPAFFLIYIPTYCIYFLNKWKNSHIPTHNNSKYVYRCASMYEELAFYVCYINLPLIRSKNLTAYCFRCNEM